MAKRTNIVRIIKEEIKKGNTYVAANGNFVSADMLEREILADFKRGLENKTIDYSISFEAFKTDRLASFTSAAEVLSGIYEVFNRVNDDSDNEEAAPDDQSVPDMPEPDSETSEPSSETSESSKPKRGKSKAGDVE